MSSRGRIFVDLFLESPLRARCRLHGLLLLGVLLKDEHIYQVIVSEPPWGIFVLDLVEVSTLITIGTQYVAYLGRQARWHEMFFRLTTSWKVGRWACESSSRDVKYRVGTGRGPEPVCTFQEQINHLQT